MAWYGYKQGVSGKEFTGISTIALFEKEGRKKEPYRHAS